MSREGKEKIVDLEHERRLAETESRSKSNMKRLDELSQQIDAVNNIATSVAVMAEQIKTMSENLQTLTGKVTALEAEPGKRWKFVVEKAIYFVVAAVVGFVLARVGL